MEEREEQRQQEQQKRLVSLPPFSPTLPEGGEYSLTSNASTAPLSDCGSYHGGDGRLPLVSTDPCSQTTATAAAASWGLTSVRSSDVWSKAAGKREMVPVEHAVTHASEASWERETKGAKRSLKGLKWGDYIRFKYQVLAWSTYLPAGARGRAVCEVRFDAVEAHPVKSIIRERTPLCMCLLVQTTTHYIFEVFTFPSSSSTGVYQTFTSCLT